MKIGRQNLKVFGNGRWLLPLVLLIVCSYSAFGISVGDYRTNLELAQADIDDLLTEIGKSELGQGNKDHHAEILKKLRERLPAGQKIDIQGGTIESDTGWLTGAIDDYETRANLSEKAVVLTGIKERLAAIDIRIDQLEAAKAAERSKDEDKQKLAEILKRQEYQKPEPPKESVIQRWIREFFEWLSQRFPEPDIKPVDGGGASAFPFFLQIVLYLALIAGIGFLIYRFAPYFVGRFGSRVKKKKGDRVILGERIAADASVNDLFSEADDLARRGELRLAIRKGYIALLCELSDRKLIGLARHKTNRDYLRDVRKRPRLFENMSGMTSTFERHWYGFKNIDAGEWEDFRATYERAVSETGQQ